MIQQVQVYLPEGASQKEKGDFLEDTFRSILESQRYEVKQRVRFSDQEIDLLCSHKDRARDTLNVECKARMQISTDDIKTFCFNVLIAKKAERGCFVHTSELQQNAAALATEMMQRNERELSFWGPDKLMELLVASGLVTACAAVSTSLTATKRILAYGPTEAFWIHIFGAGTTPTHYHAAPANRALSMTQVRMHEWIAAHVDDVQGLATLPDNVSHAPLSTTPSLDIVAEVQESDQWDDYRPVGGQFFVGRSQIRQQLFDFVRAPLATGNARVGRRVFFLEGKSGWGKSSLIAELRARSRNIRNRNHLFVLAVDSRSASTVGFAALAFEKLVARAASEHFVPPQFARIPIASSFDILASGEIMSLVAWLRRHKRVLVLVFDQFEDIFRKNDLFRAFHKLMHDVTDLAGNIVLGFSWKSEINIPIDNPAYSLWQQARDASESLHVREFDHYETDAVIGQLQSRCGRALPMDLRRRLKESSQGFPWLIKKLAIHCYHQMSGRVTPEQLIDQHLNVRVLFDEDLLTLTSDEKRALSLIARRGYDGDSFDVADIDDRIRESDIASLQSRRLIVRSGSKYNVYWDVFRDFLVEEREPRIGESFLLRQYPEQCTKVLAHLLLHQPCSIAAIRDGTSDRHRHGIGTSLNHVRELRHLGVVTLRDDGHYESRGVSSLSDFQVQMGMRLSEHIVTRHLRKSPSEIVQHAEVARALQVTVRGYNFKGKTWVTYANHFIAWLRWARVDIGRRLVDVQTKEIRHVTFIPQCRPSAVVAWLVQHRNVGDGGTPRGRDKKLQYDLKAFGFVMHDSRLSYLTRRGRAVAKKNRNDILRDVARAASGMPKIASAVEALRRSMTGNAKFEDEIDALIQHLPATSTYRKVALSVLKAWSTFVIEQSESSE